MTASRQPQVSRNPRRPQQVEPPTRIRCKRCKKVKARSRFSDDATRKAGHFPWCTDCQVKYKQDHLFQDETAAPNGHICPVDDRIVRGASTRRFCSASCKDKVSRLRTNFNLTIVDYRRLVDATGGRCPICTNRPTEWHVDHNHRTGMVTGVVCSACNVGALASTYHDVEHTRRLLSYLETTPAERLGIEAKAPPGKTKPSNLNRVWGNSAKRRRK